MAARPSLEELLSDVSSEKLDQPCQDEHLAVLSLSITDWRDTSPFLGLTEVEEEDIEHKYPRNVNRQKIAMLRKWRERKGKAATYRNLAQVFLTLGKTFLIEKISELLCSESKVPETEQAVDKPILDTYADYLRGRYRTEIPTVFTRQWPPPPTRRVFNLAMIHQENVQYGPIDEEVVQLTLRGNVDDIMHKKTPVDLEDITKLDNAERKVILIEGAPGAGKSTLAWHSCQKWESGELFQEFRTVVFVQLRDPAIQCAQTLADLLPAKSKVEAEKVCLELQKREGKHTLFVLDSFDELPSNLHENSIFEQLIFHPQSLNLQFSTLVITSRPIATADLQLAATSRVEIVGFTRHEKTEYFREALRGDSQKLQKLQDHLSERPVIEASCYLPLNAAIVVHLFLVLNQTLPTTLHGIFLSLVICCLIRHVKKDRSRVGELHGVSCLENLPLDIQEKLGNICVLAFQGIKINKVVFSTTALQSFNLSTDLSTLSLLQAVPSFAIYEPSLYYSFLHLSVQELLAAYHISKLPPDEQIQIFKELFGNPRFAAVFQYYAAFTKLRAEGIQDVIANIVKQEKSKDMYAGRALLLSLLHCLYEAQDHSLCQFVASLLERELVLAGNSLSPVDCLAVGYFLYSVCFTTSGEFTVDLCNCSLDDYRVSFLVRELSKCSSPSDVQEGAVACSDMAGRLSLDLSNNSIHGSGTRSIAQLLRSSSLFQKLHLGSSKSFKGNNRIQEGEDGLLAVLTNSSLKDLSLNYCGVEVTEESGSLLAQMLQKNKQLKSLSLSGNKFSDKGVFYIAKGLTHNCSLKKLELCDCMVRAEGANSLSKALRVNQWLESLDISHNNIGDTGRTSIFQSLTVNTTLREFHLQNCGVTEKAAELLGTVLRENRSLEVLDLSLNPNLDSGVVHIANALMHNNCLKKLNLSYCRVGDKEVESLASALAVNSTLQELNLHRAVTTDTVLILGEHLQRNRGLQTLYIGSSRGIPWSDGTVRQFVLCLQENCHLTKLVLPYRSIKVYEEELQIMNRLRRDKGLPLFEID